MRPPQLRNDQYAEETERAQRVVAEKESATLRWALDVVQKVPKDQASYWQYEMDGSWRALPPYLPYLHYVPASRCITITSGPYHRIVHFDLMRQEGAYIA